MDHSQAIQIGAAEKYLLNELEEGARSEYEEHFFDCGECAEDVKSGAAFVANAKEVLPSVTWGRVAREENGRARGAGWTALFWPAPLGAAAALALSLGLAAYQAGVVVPSLQKQVAESESLQGARWHFLSVSRSEAQVVKLGKETRTVGLTLSKSSEASFPYYRCELREADGRVVTTVVVPAPAAGEELNVALSASSLRPGSYVLVLHGLESASGAVVKPDFSRYTFTVERE